MILDQFKLDDKVCLVTGASRGIGRGIAQGFAEAGAHVVGAARTPETLEEMVEQVRGLGRRALAVPCDVNDPSSLDALVEKTIQEFGRIDVLVNNAGGTPPTPLLQLKDAAFEEAFHFNVTTAMHLSRECVRHMVERGEGGAIVNISSGLSHLVEPGFVAYGTAKAALSHMTRLMAHELAPHVRVNALAVGATLTDALGMFLNDDIQRQMCELTPMGRLGSVEDIAQAALYLASPASSWMTGKILEIDGGTVASNWPIKIPAF
jgi:7-alpha-hydroxysteroid dehydrogenase